MSTNTICPRECLSPYTGKVAVRATEVFFARNFLHRETTNGISKLGKKFSKVKPKAKEIMSKVKGLVRRVHLFAKTQAEKKKIGKKIYHTTQELQNLLTGVVEQGASLKSKAQGELKNLSEIMKKLFPQILHFLETGFVASKKIIHLQMPELYSIVRGKSGKSVEFGIKWGINRIDGFVMGFLINNGDHCSDKKFCIESIKEHIELFGTSPKTYGFDRSGYSLKNIKKANKLGVKNTGIAPAGRAKWSVSEKMWEKIRRERAQVEGVIGNLKSKKYGFNKPNVQSTVAMETSTHRSFLGFNLCKALRKLNIQELQMA